MEMRTNNTSQKGNGQYNGATMVELAFLLFKQLNLTHITQKSLKG